MKNNLSKDVKIELKQNHTSKNMKDNKNLKNTMKNIFKKYDEVFEKLSK